MTTYYKFLDTNGRGQYSGYQWPLPTANPDGTWTPGAWVAVTGALVPCGNGLHAIADVADLPRWVNLTLYTLAYDGDVLAADDKVVGRRARLLAPLPGWHLTALRWWVLDCAEHVAHLSSDPRVAACLAVTRRYLRGEATLDELRQVRRATYAAAAYAAAAAATDAATAATDAATDAAETHQGERAWQGARLLAYATGALTPGQEVPA